MVGAIVDVIMVMSRNLLGICLGRDEMEKTTAAFSGYASTVNCHRFRDDDDDIDSGSSSIKGMKRKSARSISRLGLYHHDVCRSYNSKNFATTSSRDLCCTARVSNYELEANPSLNSSTQQVLDNVFYNSSINGRQKANTNTKFATVRNRPRVVRDSGLIIRDIYASRLRRCWCCYIEKPTPPPATAPPISSLSSQQQQHHHHQQHPEVLLREHFTRAGSSNSNNKSPFDTPELDISPGYSSSDNNNSCCCGRPGRNDSACKDDENDCDGGLKRDPHPPPGGMSVGGGVPTLMLGRRSGLISCCCSPGNSKPMPATAAGPIIAHLNEKGSRPRRRRRRSAPSILDTGREMTNQNDGGGGGCLMSSEAEQRGSHRLVSSGGGLFFWPGIHGVFGFCVKGGKLCLCIRHEGKEDKL